MRIPKQEDQHSKGLWLDRNHLASLDDAELAFSNLHIREGKNKKLVLNHEFITPSRTRAPIKRRKPRVGSEVFDHPGIVVSGHAFPHHGMARIRRLNHPTEIGVRFTPQDNLGLPGLIDL